MQVVRDTGSGAQLLSIVENRRDRHEFRYDFPGYVLEQLASGHVILRKGNEMGEPMGFLDPAWSRDASGAPVATRYRTDGSILIQEILPSEGAVYPVVSDPRVSAHWWGWKMVFSPNETATIAYGSQIEVKAMCAAVGVAAASVTGIAGAVIAVWCMAWGHIAKGARKSGKCLAAKNLWGLGAAAIPFVHEC